jgi:dTDP-4-dehydrorhamnose 3,5-epimerase
LSEDNRNQVWIPRGFAHGFAVLSEKVDFFYKCDDEYSPKDETLVRWNDPAIGIDWRISNPTLSAKDATAPLLAEIKDLARYGEVSCVLLALESRHEDSRITARHGHHPHL